MSELDSIRASDAERDAAATRLQAAFAEGRIDDGEFDLRMRAALTARTRADLARLMTDLPADAPAARPTPAGSQPGRFAVTFKSSLRRAGRWRVPEHLTTVVYKGDGVLDAFRPVLKRRPADSASRWQRRKPLVRFWC